MSQRESGYSRIANDVYPTPAWVTEALIPHLPAGIIWEPACGEGAIVDVLRRNDRAVVATDIIGDIDFLTFESTGWIRSDGIVTNPPYSHAQQFIEQALRLTEATGFVAMLLRCDFDHAKTRRHLFADCPAFAKKLILTRRIVWFQRPGAAPSFNHAWFIWDWRHQGPPTIAYD